HYEKRFKILYVNSPSVFHFAIPSNPDEYIFLISVPFIRTLDLTKLEISLLLFEDYMRLKRGFFKKRVAVKGLKEFIGSNFHESKKLNMKILKKVAMKYDEVVFDKGFSFKEQFEVTKDMGNVLKSDLKLWSTYYKMLGKIDDLVKSNILYRTYNKIYPSPEMQINWLKPKNKIL
ncbi:MAG: hypothetical protein HOM21_15540, partial [Halobacteriovoraceae bacterium]|nr:hypothetical protein [Halobacteriovoraceae bacterium]